MARFLFLVTRIETEVVRRCIIFRCKFSDLIEMHVGSLHVHAPPPPRAPPKYPVVQGSSLEADNNTLKQVDQLMVYVDNMEREYVRRFSKIDEMMENYRDFVANVQKHNKIFKCLLCLVNYNVSIGEMKLPPGSETILSREVV